MPLRHQLSAMTFGGIASLYDLSVRSVRDRTDFIKSTAPYADDGESETVQSMEVSFAMMADSSANKYCCNSQQARKSTATDPPIHSLQNRTRFRWSSVWRSTPQLCEPTLPNKPIYEGGPVGSRGIDCPSIHSMQDKMTKLIR